MSSKLGLPESKRFGYLDTETTGTSAHDQVVEVSLISEDGKILFNSLIKPTVPVNPFAYKVHKIGDKELSSAPGWDQIFEEFNNASLNLDAIYIYNEAFDRRLLWQTYDAHGLDFPYFNFVCAHKMAKSWMKNNGFNNSKSNLDLFCSLSGASLSGVDRHRALGDCILIKRAFDAIESGNSLGINETPRIGHFLSGLNSPLSSSISVDSRSHIKDSIDQVMYNGISFSEYVLKLQEKGIDITPVFGDENNPEFNACYYSYKNSKFPGSKIGKNYSAPAILKKGLIFNSDTDGDLLRKLFFKGKLNDQKETFLNLGKEVLGESYDKLINLNWPVKSFYVVKQLARINNLRISSEYTSTKISNDVSHRGQYSIDELFPKSIKIRSLSLNEIKMEFEYKNHLDELPFSVSITTENGLEEITGEKCVYRAIKSIENQLYSDALSMYFKNEIESETYSISQEMVCSFEGDIIARIQRFAEKISVNQCSLYPSLKALDEKNYEATLESNEPR